VGAAGAAAATAVFVVLFGGTAFAGGQVTMPDGNPASMQTFTVSGSGFPPHRQDPTGLQVLECADPGGTQSNLPRDASRCDGSTVNPNQINTDAGGNFTARYTFIKLNAAHTSNIDCDATHFCVLWVGVDYNGNFLGPHAFTRAFQIGGSGAAGSSTPVLAIVLPIVGVALGAGFLVVRRRSRGSPPNPIRPARAPVTKKARVGA